MIDFCQKLIMILEKKCVKNQSDQKMILTKNNNQFCEITTL
jgi:hypothetical protein